MGLANKRIFRGQKRALAVICTVLFLTFLDNTVVSVVLAGIQTSLNADVQDLQWIVDGYMLVFAVMMLTGGTLGDLFGRKKVMLSGVAIFSAGSIICMVASSPKMLIAGRVIMGIGAAGSEPGTLSTIRHVFEDEQKRARALSVWAAVSGVALALGPIIGGILVGLFSWRRIFTFNLALGILVLVAGYLVLPESSDPEGRKLDIKGLIVGGLALATATCGIIFGETSGYLVWWVDLLLASSLALGAAFVFVEKRQDDPVLPIKYFGELGFSGANIVAFATNFGVFTVFFFTALYLQIIGGFSGLHIALAFIAMAVVMVVSAIATGYWEAKRGALWPSVIGCALGGIGLFLVDMVLSPHVGTGQLVWTLVIVGIGFGMTLTTMTTIVLRIVPPDHSGMAASTVNTFREMGGLFSVAILGAIVNSRLTGNLKAKLQSLGLPDTIQSLVIHAVTHGGNVPGGGHAQASQIKNHSKLVNEVTQAAYAAFGHGLDLALYIAGAILLASAVIAWFFLRHRFAPGN
jgi:EmrB/QacA subfamily drug resistance transporter